VWSAYQPTGSTSEERTGWNAHEDGEAEEVPCERARLLLGGKVRAERLGVKRRVRCEAEGKRARDGEELRREARACLCDALICGGWCVVLVLIQSVSICA
jgi:hypothetical protein